MSEEADEGSSAPATQTIPIRRGPQYAVVTADLANSVFLGHDIETVFLSASPHAGAVLQSDDGSISMQMMAVYNETVRVRSNPGAAVTIAMSILRAALIGETHTAAELREELESTIKTSSSGKPEDVAQPNG